MLHLPVAWPEGCVQFKSMRANKVSGAAGTFVRLAMDQLLWAPIFLSTIVAAQFTLEVSKHMLLPQSQHVAVMWDQALYGVISE